MRSGGRARDVFVGRDTERAVLADLLARADRTGAAILVLGEPGIGKTALLDAAAATTTARVLRLRGTESEAVLPFAGAADLLLPLRRHFDALPETQRRALEVALSLADGPPPPPLAVCAGALGVLSAAAEVEPVAVFVDDFPWLDPESRQVITFLSRRMPTERAVLVVAARSLPGQEPPIPHVPVLTLGGLGLDECRQLAERFDAPDPEQAAAVLLEGTGGNPLAIRETLARAGPGRSAIYSTVSIGPVLTRAWQAVLDRMPDRTRLALFVTALGRTSVLPALPLALAALGLAMEDLAPAIADGLLHWSDNRAELRHPLLRQVLIESVPLDERLRVYQAVAPLASPEQQAWLLALEVPGHRDDLADQLMSAAGLALARGGYESAAELQSRAAQLTSDPDVRVSRLLEAAGNAFVVGNVSLAGAWSGEARRISSPGPLRAMASLIHGRAQTWAGEPRAAVEELHLTASELEQGAPALAAALHFDATMPAAMLGEAHHSTELGRNGLTLDPSPGFQGSVMAAAALALSDDLDRARSLLRRADAMYAGIDPVHEQQAVLSSAHARVWIEWYDEAGQILSTCIRELRDRSAPALLPFALDARSELAFRTGRWAAAYADALEALTWAEELRQPAVIALSGFCVARVEAGRGLRSLSAQRIAETRPTMQRLELGSMDVYYESALGLGCLGVGDFDDAVRHLRTAWDRARRGGLLNPCAVPYGADLAEAEVRAGNLEAAADAAAWLEERAETTGFAYPAMGAARCRGMLAKDLEEAQEHFRVSLSALERVPMPFEVARTLLAEGEVLRRHRHPAAAKAPLLQAQEIFRGLGARTWAARCSAELAASGTVSPRLTNRGNGIDLLTPQELQVAREIAAGRSNPEAAEALFLSRKTVEAHLTRVYRKLGVRSRTELTRALVEAGMVDD